MPDSPLVAAGAQVPPISAAALHTNEFFTGMWTQGNPLGAGAVPFLYQKFYSAARFDRLIGGLNMEVTTRLTLARRPGHSVYNATVFPAINRFYEFRAFSAGSETIHVLASLDPAVGDPGGSVRDVSAPTNNIKLWQQPTNAGRTSFQSVGNICYFADTVTAHKWVLSGQQWAAATAFSTGQFIVDSNNNLQLAIGAQTATITNIISEFVTIGHGGAPGRKITLFFSPSTPVNLKNNIRGILAGLTTIPGLNGNTPYTIVAMSEFEASFIIAGNVLPVIGYSAETGTLSTGTGITGGAAPAWNLTTGLVTQDGGLQWVNMGSSVQAWGSPPPADAPTVTQAPSPTLYPAWQADTWYGPVIALVDGNGNVQQLTTSGTTGGAAPAWNVVVGGVTIDNTAQWTNQGPAVWVGSTAYAVGAMIVATFTYTITTGVSVPYPPYFITTPHQVTVTCAFQCTVAGTSGVNQPAWVNGAQGTVVDGTVTWTNRGNPITWATIGAAQLVSTAQKIADSNFNIESPLTFGKSGPGPAPVWKTDSGASTADGTMTWLNGGPYSPAATAAWKWAYSGKNSITGHITTASPLSSPLTIGAGYLPVLQGAGLSDPQIDTIVLWRTLQGGSTLLYEDEFDNPDAGQSWVYTDTMPDSALNELITAPINSTNNPPPVGWTPQCYYLNRIWGWAGNILQWSTGPQAVTGSGNEGFSPANQFPFPSAGVACWPTSIGLVCYTNSDVWLVLGQGTSNSPFYVINFQQGVGLGGQDALCVNGSTAYGMLTSSQVVSMDPGAGELEVGFPIGDLFTSAYTPGETYCVWHQGSSADMGLYVADGATGWYRMASTAAPESGNVWSPRAVLAAGVKAIASIEIQPGIRRLLVGPGAAGGPILMRDGTASDDHGAAFTTSVRMGSIVLAQPGSSVGVQFITTEEKTIAGASPASVGVLLDEISGPVNILTVSSNDPPNQPRSKTVTTNRWWVMQSAQPVTCRHLQVEISWPAESHANELMTYTIYGRLPEKARK